ncbi:hypothetical protein [Rickettsiella endosymbiont of Dermanyssus gallinae]|uniref:hypothetical protein n=1 Tax=Rickettsiella endosymbiont of Dermanyssus gallinae TaxID=2856608 RepID=UPI001C52DE01|nr:hypothetical protein [Rickettsiella endosymbiont of Dermanyssus gallinae]
MDPNEDILVAEFADSEEQLLQFKSPLKSPLELWVTDCFSMSATKHQVWASNWIESLRVGLREADSKTIKHGYQQLTDQLTNLLQQQHSINDWVSALLLQLIAMYVYRKNAIKQCYPDQLIELQAKQWKKHATCVMVNVPTEVYLNLLLQLVDEARDNKPIDNTLDRALLKIHQHALKFCFKQLLNELRNTTQDCPPPDAESSVYMLYEKIVCMLHVYINQLSTLKPKEKELLPNRLLNQLTQLIEETSTLDLSPSWMDRLKQWIELFFGKLQLLYKEISSAEKISSSALRTISERLQEATKKAVQNKKLQSPESIELIRKRCWLYFSLHEKLISQWGNKEKHALEYQSTALALFESFMSTFDWPTTFNKGILRANPLKSYRSTQNTFVWFTRFKEEILHGNPLKAYQSAKQVIPVEHWEPLVDKALNKLCVDFFMRDWARNHGCPNKRSFLQWLLSRQEPRLIAKIKAHVNSQETELQQLNEVSTVEKTNIYGFVQAIYEDLCADLNQITQMILSIWFQKIGFNIPHKDLGNFLSEPGRWLCQTDQARPTRLDVDIPFFTLFMLQAIERLGKCLGVGVCFFPSLQQHWSAHQKALAAHSGNAAEFVHNQNKNIATIIRKLYLIFHTDHKPDADTKVKDWATCYIPKIKSIKDDLAKFRKRDQKELQSLDAIEKAQALLDNLKEVVLDGMNCHLREYSQETRQHNSVLKQIEADTAKTRKEKEAIQAEIVHLRAELAKARAKRKPQARSQPTVARSRAALFRTNVKRKPQMRSQPSAPQDTERAGSSNSVFPNR